MKSTFISKEKNVVKFSMEFTADEFEKAQIAAYQKTKDQFAIDGFRKGKAPRSIIEKHYGEGIFFDEAINSLMQENYPKALDELNLEVIDSPKLSFEDIAKSKDLIINVEVEVYPDVEVKDYLGVEIDKIEKEVTDEDIDNEIKNLQKRNSRMVLVDRPVQDGDTVLLDYAGYVGEEQFEGGTAERYPLKIGSGTFIPGFEEQIVGAKAGDDVDVKVTFPEEYHAENLAGAEAVFKCKIHEVKEEEVPEVDDEFVKDVSECDTLDEFKAQIRENLEKAAKANAEMEMKNAVLEKVYEANDLDVPNAMVEDEITNMMREFDQQLRAQGMSLEKYFEYLQTSTADFREQVRDEAAKKVKTRMIVQAIAEQENIQADKEDVDKEIDFMAMQYQLDANKIKEMLGPDNIAFIEKDIKIRKAIDYIFEKAVIK